MLACYAIYISIAENEECLSSDESLDDDDDMSHWQKVDDIRYQGILTYLNHSPLWFEVLPVLVYVIDAHLCDDASRCRRVKANRSSNIMEMSPLVG